MAIVARRHLVVAVLLAGACAGSTSSAGTTAPVLGPPVADDWGLDLVGRLPRGADVCGVARPSLLGANERRLYAGIAHAPPLAWHAELGVTAYATAERGRRASTLPAEIVLLRVEATEARTRELLGSASGLELRWGRFDRTACGPDACPSFASFVEPNLVRIERGPWPESPSAKGAVSQCRALAEAYPDALEIWLRRARELPQGPAEDQPLRWISVVRASARGIRIEGEERMPSAEVAERVLQAGADPTRMAQRLGVAALGATRRRVASAVTSEIHLRWEDLELVRQDEERFTRAQRYAAALGRVVPDPEVELDSVDSVAAQIRARLELVENATLPDPDVEASTRALIERARARHPGAAVLEELRVRFEQRTSAEAR